jgi:hypothetical protein
VSVGTQIEAGVHGLPQIGTCDYIVLHNPDVFCVECLTVFHSEGILYRISIYLYINIYI